MALAQRDGRSRHRLILLALTAITLLTVDLNGFGPAETAQKAVRDVLNPITDLAATILSPVGDAWNSVFNYGDLEAENEALRAEVDELRGAAIRGEADSATLQRLLEAVDLPYVGDIERVEAEVIRGPGGNFANHVITIDRGSGDGVAEGMAVVTGAGMVGRIDEVDRSTSTVQLISDPGLPVGVRLVATDEVGLGHAVAGEDRGFVIDQGLDWPDTSDPELLPPAGSAVVTASESAYPAEIPVGTVVEARRGSDEVSMEVEVELANDVGDLHYVVVLLVEVGEVIELSPLVPSTSVPLEGLDPAALDPGGEDGGEEAP